MLARIDRATGAVPPGRYPATLDEVRAAYVDANEFAASATRVRVWQGFLDYISVWELVERQVGGKLVIAWWFAGSFISAAMDPEDIDVTPILDSELLEQLTGTPGMGQVKKLIGHRDSVRARFHVEPFTLKWSAVECTLFPQTLSPANQYMLMVRGGLDAWWQRLRPPGPKGPPTLPKAFAERGYLEVLR